MAMGRDVVGDGADAILLSTDADSYPRSDWVQTSRRALARSDVAAGRIIRMDADRDPTQCRIEAYFDRLHAVRRSIDPVAWDPSPGCHFGGGANLAFRADVYRSLGGFKEVPAGEDAGLLDDAARAGFRVRRDPSMVVWTSSRRVGRAEGGLATMLGASARGVVPAVADPTAALWQYEHHAAARRAFADRHDAAARAAFGRKIGLSGDHVLGVARECINAEAFAMRIVPAAVNHDALISLDRAEMMLSAVERTLWRGAA